MKFHVANPLLQRAVPGNLNKRLSGKPATFDAHIGRKNGAGNDEENEAKAWSGIQGQGGFGGAVWGQDAGGIGAAV